ncbi:MAG: hypothetical protein GF315_06015 [candidate division Zixibacteria bacterium]|nr:hypothetical protein [candidate division Zixibacteria bacterium]
MFDMFKTIKELWGKDNLLVTAYENAFKMLSEGLSMFSESVKSLRESDVGKIDFNIYDKDIQINKLQRRVRKQIVTHVAVGGYAGSADVAPGLALTSIIIDVERIADYAKNIWELAVAHPKKLQCGPLEQEVSFVEKAVKDKFQRVIDALRETDDGAASAILHDYQEVSKHCDRLVEKLIKDEVGEMSQGDAVATALYIRYLKRVNGHLTNITTSVINPFHRIGFQPKEIRDAQRGKK